MHAGAMHACQRWTGFPGRDSVAIPPLKMGQRGFGKGANSLQLAQLHAPKHSERLSNEMPRSVRKGLHATLCQGLCTWHMALHSQHLRWPWRSRRGEERTHKGAKRPHAASAHSKRQSVHACAMRRALVQYVLHAYCSAWLPASGRLCTQNVSIGLRASKGASR